MNALDSFYHKISPHLRKMGKTRENITLVIASKYFSVEQILKLYDMGQRDFGENKVQDALHKMMHLPKDIRWHFLGHLQKNKVNKIVNLFELIHSVDSLELAQKINDRSKGRQNILLQVNTSREESKEGMTPEEFVQVFKAIEGLEHIYVQGLMTLAPLHQNEEVIRKTFRDLKILKDQYGNPSWHLSMGMSQDYPIALEEGTDILRLGHYFKSLV